MGGTGEAKVKELSDGRLTPGRGTLLQETRPDPFPGCKKQDLTLFLRCSGSCKALADEGVWYGGDVLKHPPKLLLLVFSEQQHLLCRYILDIQYLLDLEYLHG